MRLRLHLVQISDRVMKCFISGKPYDTPEEAIGIRPSRGSLAEYGVTYQRADLLENGDFI